MDGQVTPCVPSLPWARIETLLEAKVVEADPRGAAERGRAAELEQFVSTGRYNEHGLTSMIVKANAGDVILLVAMCERIAEVLLLRGDASPVGVRRAKAVGILADPARALRLLAEHAAGNAVDRAGSEPGSDEPDVRSSTTAEATDSGPTWLNRPAPALTPPTPTMTPTTSPRVRPADRAEPRTVPGDADGHAARPRRSRGPAVAVHRRHPHGHRSARVEGIGPLLTDQVREWLRHRDVRVVPVVDTADVHAGVDSYEVPAPHGYWCRVDRTRTHLIGTTPSMVDLAGGRPDPRSAGERALADLVRDHCAPD